MLLAWFFMRVNRKTHDMSRATGNNESKLGHSATDITLKISSQLTWPHVLSPVAGHFSMSICSGNRFGYRPDFVYPEFVTLIWIFLPVASITLCCG